MQSRAARGNGCADDTVAATEGRAAMERSRTAIARPVPILRYLCVDPRPSDSSISIDAVLFGDQMDALIDRDFIPLTIQHLATAIRFDAPLPTRSVLITFDQGLTGFYRYALPALEASGYSIDRLRDQRHRRTGEPHDHSRSRPGTLDHVVATAQRSANGGCIDRIKRPQPSTVGSHEPLGGR